MGRRGSKWVLAGTAVAAAILVSAELVIWFYPGENLVSVNPYPSLWPNWSAVSGYVPSPATWNELGPNSGATDLVVPDPLNPGTVFAAGRFMGIYRSSDDGATWEGLRLGQYYVTSLVVDRVHRGVVFAVAGGSLYRSEDRGSTWGELSACDGKATTYLIDQHIPETSYLTCGSDLLVSHDNGSTWASTFSESGVQSLVYVAKSNGVLYLIGISQSNQFVILRSTDGGATWSLYTTGWNALVGILRPSLAVDPANSSVLLANAPDGIARSVNAGANWTLVIPESFGVTGGFVSFDSSNGSAYAGRVQLYRSDDHGATFKPIGSWNIDCLTSPVPVYHADIGSIAFLDGGRRIMISTDGGVDVSTDDGAHWACHPVGITNALTYDVQVDPFDPSHLITTRQDYYPAQSFDYGKTWQTVYAIQSEWGSVRFDPIDRGVIYVASGGGVWKSTNSGQTFDLARKGLPAVPFPSSPRLAMDYQNPRTLWLSLGDLGLYKSDDAASSWHQISQLKQSAQVDGRGNVAYAVASNGTIGGVWKTTDGGGSWSRLSLPLTEQYFEVKIDPNNASVMYVVGSELHVSLDGGRTFRSVQVPGDLSQSQQGTFGPSPYTLLVQRFGNLSRIVLAAAKYGYKANVYESFDRGASWQAIGGDLGSTMVLGISFNPSYPIQLYLATFGQGVLSERVEVPVTLHYSLQGPQSGFTSPTLTYASSGQEKSVTVGPAGGTYLVDWGTFWVLLNPVPAPPFKGRWLGNETTAGTATVPISLNPVFTFSTVAES